MAEYFSHDYGARNDPKLLQLQAKMGQEGKGIYWDLIEFIYEQGGYIMRSECEGIAFAIHTDCDKMLRVLTEFDLFRNNGEKFYSDSVLRRINHRHTKSLKASESAKKRWSDAKAMRTHSEGNARKGKKRKEKESIKEPDLSHPLQKYISENCPEVSKLSKQLTYEEAEKITKSFDKDLIKDKLANMENKKGLSKNYVSVYKTLDNWCKTQFNRGPSFTQPTEKKQTIDDLERYKNS